MAAARGSKISKTEETMLAAIAGVLLVLWLLGFLAFHVTTGTIHILLVLALIFVVMHFFRGRGATI
jgi:energy-converting hydrogenase Eha subunit G